MAASSAPSDRSAAAAMPGGSCVTLAAAQSQPLLVAEGLQVAFADAAGTRNAVDHVSLTIQRGETLALLGESGCGKSLTALAIMGLLPPALGARISGRIVFDAIDLGQASPADLRNLRGRRIAMIFQNPLSAMNPVLTIGRQLGETLRRHLQTPKHAVRPAAIRLLAQVGIHEPERRIDAYPHELSGGMCQRVMIAMALSCHPDLLIADEPTTALDVTVQRQIMELLRTLARENGTAILLITHDLGVVAENADRVAVMYAGRIVEQAPVAALFEAPAHPYTRGLLRAMPRLDSPPGSFHAIPGTVPDAHHMPAGCRFAPRCHAADQRCHRYAPPLESRSPGHVVACWHAQSGPLQ